MRKEFSMQTIAGFLALILLLCGCERKCEPAPELMAPVMEWEGCRSVERGRIGDVERVTGHVMPKESCYFWEKNVQIAELRVREGDQVEKGDVLAVLDTEQIKQAIEDLKKDKTLENQQFLIAEESYNYQHQEMEYASTLAYERHFDEAVKEYQKSIQELEENHRFDGLLHSYRQGEIEKQIKEYQAVLDESVLIAEGPGVVTYCKDITKSLSCSPTENVVVISDMEDCYIELEMAIAPKKEGEKWTEKKAFAYVDGVPCELEEYKYSAMEMVVFENREQYPQLRYQLVDETKMPEAGEDVLVSIEKDLHEDALLVGIDSLYQDEKGDYVYVNQDGRKVMRRVELGKKNQSMVEVLSGIDEGELVYYSALTNSEVECEWISLERRDYGLGIKYETFEKAKLLREEEVAAYSGSIVDLPVKSGDVVKKGDVVCTLQTTIGNARLTELRKEVENLQQSHMAELAGYEEQQKNITKEQEENEKQKTQELMEISRWYNEMLLLPEPPENLQEEFDRQVADVERWYGYQEEISRLESLQLDCEKRMGEAQFALDLERSKRELRQAEKNNNGKGTVQIHASQDGIITYENLVKDYQVYEGEILFQIWEERDDMITFRNKEVLPIARQIDIYDSDGNLVNTGKIVATSGDTKWHSSQKEDYVYLTENKNRDSEYYTYYVALSEVNPLMTAENTSLYFYYFCYKNMLIIPKMSLEWDYTSIQASDRMYYVWTLEDGRTVKRYVEVGDADSKGTFDWYLLGGIKEDAQIQMFSGEEWVY